MKEDKFDFYNTLNDLTDLLSEFLYKEICKESPNSFYSYVHENLSIRSKEMCQNIDDIFQLDLNPLIAVIHQLKGIIIGMKIIKEPIFFSYLAVIQQIRNITFHKPKNFQNSQFREINWILTIDLVLDELPESLKKDKSFSVEFKIVFKLKNISSLEIVDLTFKEFFSNISLISVYLIFFKIFIFQI